MILYFINKQRFNKCFLNSDDLELDYEKFYSNNRKEERFICWDTKANPTNYLFYILGLVSENHQKLKEILLNVTVFIGSK